MRGGMSNPSSMVMGHSVSRSRAEPPFRDRIGALRCRVSDLESMWERREWYDRNQWMCCILSYPGHRRDANDSRRTASGGTSTTLAPPQSSATVTRHPDARATTTRRAPASEATKCTSTSSTTTAGAATGLGQSGLCSTPAQRRMTDPDTVEPAETAIASRTSALHRACTATGSWSHAPKTQRSSEPSKGTAPSRT